MSRTAAARGHPEGTRARHDRTYDPKTSLKVGNILGVQGFVFGSVSGRPNAFSVMTKLVDAETGSTVWSLVLSNNIERMPLRN